MPARQKSALLIAGPTASGKSALAMRLAAERNGVIINADSMQVYAELRILSARPTPEDEARIPHKLYGHVSGSQDYSVAQWLAEATNELQCAWSSGQTPIICGGTGLYFRTLEQGLASVPAIDPEIRRHWREYSGDLHDALLRHDPAMAERLHPSDRQRVTRALEVITSTGTSLLAWQRAGHEASPLRGVAVERLYLDQPREVLNARSDLRLERMFAAGAVEEVQALPHWPATRPIMKAIGVPELLAYLRGEISLTEALAQAKIATRHYIKRQCTWWRPHLAAWTRCR